MDYYKLRIDGNSLDLIQTFVDRYSTRYFFCFEDQYDHPHFHLYIETNSKQATIRNYVRKNFGGGNGSYSMKNCEETPVEYIAYMMKQGQYRTNLDEEIIETARKHDLKVKDEIKKKKESKKTIYQKLKEIIPAKFEEHKVEWDISHTPTITEEFILDTVIDWYAETETSVREFQIVSQVQTLSLYFIPSYREKLKNNIRMKMNPIR